MTGRWATWATWMLAAGLTAGRGGQEAGPAADEKGQLLLVVDRLDSQLAKLARRPDASLRIRDGREWLAYLRDRAGAWQPAKPEAGRALRVGLELDHHALAELPGDAAAARDIIGAVIDDIEVKARHCRRKGLASLITVKVRTFRGQTETGGLEVFYLPRLLALSGRAAPDRFPALSASEKELAPGRYVFWAGRAAGTGTTVSVGDGKAAMTIDLLAP